ncbi:MAG: hypothetical protein GX673_12580 [Gammaproteobacteria bacterium]|nr:hypothetical protein [Gammaproteobacteria bacterium]
MPITIKAITKTAGTNTGRRIVETLDDLSVVVLSEVIVGTPLSMLNFGANVSQLETCKPYITGKKAMKKQPARNYKARNLVTLKNVVQ